jgi:hypothetical protein
MCIGAMAAIMSRAPALLSVDWRLGNSQMPFVEEFYFTQWNSPGGTLTFAVNPEFSDSIARSDDKSFSIRPIISRTDS